MKKLTVLFIYLMSCFSIAVEFDNDRNTQVYEIGGIEIKEMITVPGKPETSTATTKDNKKGDYKVELISDTNNHRIDPICSIPCTCKPCF